MKADSSDTQSSLYFSTLFRFISAMNGRIDALIGENHEVFSAITIIGLGTSHCRHERICPLAGSVTECVLFCDFAQHNKTFARILRHILKSNTLIG